MTGIPAFNMNGILTKYLGISDKTLGIPPEYAFILFLLAACFPLYMIAHLAHRSQTKYEFLSPGLRAVTGKFGAGKTYLMTWAALACMKQGVRAVKGYDRRAITGKEILILAMLAGAGCYFYVLAFMGEGYFFAGGIVAVYCSGYCLPVAAFSKWSCTPVGNG